MEAKQHLAHFDPSELTLLVGDDVVPEVLAEYINSLIQLQELPQPNEATTKNEGYAMLVHSLKSSSQFIGATQAYRLSEQLDVELNQNATYTPTSIELSKQLFDHSHLLAQEIKLYLTR